MNLFKTKLKLETRGVKEARDIKLDIDRNILKTESHIDKLVDLEVEAIQKKLPKVLNFITSNSDNIRADLKLLNDEIIKSEENIYNEMENIEQFKKNIELKNKEKEQLDALYSKASELGITV